MNHNTKTSYFKKSLLSIAIISSLGLAVLAIQKSQSNIDSLSKVKRSQLMQQLENSMSNTNVEDLALIAQTHLLSTQEIQEEELLLEAELAMQTMQKTDTMAVLHQSELDSHQEINKQAAQQGSEQESVIENEVLFAFDSSEVNPSYFQSLNETAELIKNSDASLSSLWQVVGYTDSTGNKLYNITLAKKRAQAVAQYLVTKGVAAEKLTVMSLGDSKTNITQTTKATNHLKRRVEIHPYQAEITALVKQLNKQKNNLVKVQIEKATAKQVVNKIVAIEGHSIDSENSVAEVQGDFAMPMQTSITTAMDL